MEDAKGLAVAVMLVAVSLCVAVLLGCGGGGSLQPASTDQAGSLVIRLEAPGPSRDGRYVPPEAASITAYVFSEGNLSAVQRSATVNLPSDSIAISGVPVGPKDIRLSAFDATDGTGNAVAWGVCQAIVQWGQENLGHVYMEGYRLILLSNRDTYTELYRVTPDGHYATRLTNNLYFEADPAPSPDGKKTAFAMAPGSSYEICIYDNNTGGITTLADLTGDDLYPAWSPDSRRIAWINLSGSNYYLKIENADGSGGISSLLLGTKPAWRPAWSPDGTRIAFEEYDGTDWEIEMVRADLSGSVWLVTDDSIDETYPVWSYDGSQIYVSAGDAPASYQLACLDGSSGFWPGNTYSPTFLTNEPWGHNLWGISPDGNLLVYWATSWEAGQNEIYYLDIGPEAPVIGGSHQSIRVTYNSADDIQASFRPPTTGSGTVGAQ